MSYRLYVDEVGNADMGASDDPNHRYLSLTGLIFDIDYVRNVLAPEVEALKGRYFNSHPDDPIILHRKELVNRTNPFHALQDPETEKRFNQELIEGIERWQFVALTVVLDKLKYRTHYSEWRYDPYHYGLHLLLDRYIPWLEERQAKGDVLAEARGKREDRRLQTEFTRLYEQGTDHLRAERIAARLSSRELKLKSKSDNVAGLQIADLLAHPAFRAAVCAKEESALPNNFGGKIASILLESKFERDLQTRGIEGWGICWLP